MWEGRLSELFCVVLCTEVVHSHKHTIVFFPETVKIIDYLRGKNTH